MTYGKYNIAASPPLRVPAYMDIIMPNLKPNGFYKKKLYTTDFVCTYDWFRFVIHSFKLWNTSHVWSEDPSVCFQRLCVDYSRIPTRRICPTYTSWNWSECRFPDGVHDPRLTLPLRRQSNCKFTLCPYAAFVTLSNEQPKVKRTHYHMHTHIKKQTKSQK